MTHQRISYQSLDIEIGPAQGRDYPAKVRGPGGEAAGTFRLPFGPSELESRLKDVQIALLRATGRRRTVLSPQEQAVRDFGRALFEALLAGDLRGCYDRSLLLARQQGQGLRIRLRIQPPELLPLPWEFLYDPSAGEYLCLSRHTPLVRYVELPQPTQPLAVALPLRVLALAAGPKDLPPLDLEQERRRLERAVEPLRARGLVELHWLEGATWRDLRRAVLAEPWHVFHFIGHGGFSRERDEGFLALCDDHGETFRLNATQLARLLSDQRALRLAVLNACEGARSGGQDEFSSTASILVRRGIPAVIAMQEAITDTAGIEFAQSFYEALAEGLPIDTAVADARIAISVALGETLEWSVPVLFLRAEDGVLFEVGEMAQTISSAVDQVDKAEEHYQRGVMLNEQKMYAQAILELNMAISLRQDRGEYYYQRSESYHYQRHYDRAIDDLNRAIHLKPGNAFYYKERGVSYDWKGNYDYAIADFDQAIQLDPNKANYYRCRGVSYNNKGEYDSAIADYDRAIELDPNKADYYCCRGVSYSKKGEEDRAIADFDRAIELDPNKANHYRDRGVSYSKKGDYDRSIADFDRAIELDPNQANYYRERSVSYSKKGEYDRAIADYNRAIELDPNQADYYRQRGVSYALKGEYDSAIADYNRAIELDPNQADYYRQRGVSYSKKRENERAIADFDRAIQLDPNNADFYRERSVSYHNKGFYDQAILDDDRAILLEPNRAGLYYDRGISYSSKDENDLAIADFDRAIQIDPNKANYYHHRGRAYERKGDRVTARSDFERAVVLGHKSAIEDLKRILGFRFAAFPELYSAEYYYKCGVSYSNNRQFNLAIADFNQAIGLDQNVADYYYERGICYSNQDEFNSAIADFDRAIFLDQRVADYYCARGINYNNKGDYDRAIADYSRAISLESNRADFYNQRGLAYESKEDRPAAKRDFERAVELGHKPARENLKRVSGFWGLLRF